MKTQEINREIELIKYRYDKNGWSLPSPDRLRQKAIDNIEIRRVFADDEGAVLNGTHNIIDP